jgi:hypothetical protein
MMRIDSRSGRMPVFLALAMAWLVGWVMAGTQRSWVGTTAGPARAEAEVAKPMSLEERVAALEAKLEPLTRQGDDLYITRANLHLVNGLGSTDTVNGLGNLIIGYNEPRDDKSNARSGSHNLVVGKRNNYTSYGGVVFGLFNHPTGPYATVCGGSGNKPFGFAATVSGGRENIATGPYSAIGGGYGNQATGEYATVSGGKQRLAREPNAWAAGELLQEK